MDNLKTCIRAVKSNHGKSLDHIDAIVFLLQSKLNEGLEDEEVEGILKLLTSKTGFENSTITSFKRLLFVCVPRGPIRAEIMDIVLVWLLSVYHTGNSSIIGKVNVVLEWLTGLLDFNIVDKKQVDKYYNMYYGLLLVSKLQKRVCKLLYQLTRPEDIYRGRVERVYQLHLTNGKAKHTSTLLGLFKMFKPEMVPQDVSMFNIDAAFGKLSPGLKSAFAQAQSRILEQGGRNGLMEPHRLEWKGISSNKGSCVIPSASYVHIGSELYHENRRRVIEFLDKASLAHSQLHTELPSCVLSLLLNEGGIHLLATHRDIQARFSFALFSTLNSVFFSNYRCFKYEHRDELLKTIINFEEYMQQGIPVVSRFLALYMVSWNGLDHRQHIYKLLERITFRSFDDFRLCILGHLQTLFISAAISEKCQIIHTFKGIIFNAIIAGDWVHKEVVPEEHLFLGTKQGWSTDLKNILANLIQVVADLCHQGLLLTLNDPIVLHSALSFYESLLDLQVEANKEITIIPPPIFYRALFSQHFSAFSRACNLLVRYKDLEGHLKGFQNARWLNDYSCDVWNSFMNKKAFVKGNQGFIFQKDSEKLRDIFERDAAFTLESNLVSFGLLEQLKEMTSKEAHIVTPQIVDEAMAAAFPDVARCMDAVRRKYSDYH